METISLSVIAGVLCFGLFHAVNAASSTATRLAVSSPGEAHEQGMLNLMCEIWNFNPTIHDVRLSRRVGDRYDRLTWNDGIEEEPAMEFREMYLAKGTQQEEGTVIYLLSMLKVSREDAGNYSCQVIHRITYKLVAEDITSISVNYVPGETFPMCTSEVQQRTLEIGKPVVFNCTSEQAYPGLKIEWKRANPNNINPVTSVQYSHEEEVYSELTLTPAPSDDGAVFICTLTSPAFPDYLKTCFVGPLNVKGNSQIPSVGSSGSDGQSIEPTTFKDTDVSNKRPPGGVQPGVPSLESNTCRNACSKIKETPWFAGTLVTIVAAVLFLVLDILFLCKLNRLSGRTSRGQGSHSRYLNEDVYVELPQTGGGGQNRLYMTLEPAGKGGQRTNGGDQHLHHSIIPIPPTLIIHQNDVSCMDRINQN